MKKLLLIWLLLFAIGSAVGAYRTWGITLAWDPNTDSAIGYIVYYQQTGNDTTYSEVVQGRESTTITIDSCKFQPGSEYSFWATAYNNGGESGPSNTVTWTAPEFIPESNPAPVIINVPGTPASVTIHLGG